MHDLIILGEVMPHVVKVQSGQRLYDLIIMNMILEFI